MDHFVSIIIPTFNSEKTLNNCLRALFNQTVSGDCYEVIVVDDGSTDNTREVVTRYRGKYYYQKNQGPASARNRGVEIARGELVLFTDADCEVERNWIEEMCKPFTDSAVVGAKGIYKTRQKEIVARFAQLEYEEKFEKMSKDEFIDFVDTYAAGFRKTIFKQFGGFSTSFREASGEDTDFSFRIAKEGHKMIFVPTAIVYHQHPNTLKKYFKRKFKTAYWRVLLYRQHPGKMMKDSHTPQTLKLQILLFYVMLLGLLGLAFSGGALGLGIPFGLFFLTTIPFVVRAAWKDLIAGVFSMPLLFFRASAFSFGLMKGIWGYLFLPKRR
jgi:glycosyltransferase involved in cell wall biosynthesis